MQMIQRIPISNQFRTFLPTQFIWFERHREFSLSEFLQQLYQGTSQQSRTLYGINLYHQQSLGQGGSGLLKINLENKTKQYITWCYLILNWESLSVQNLDAYLNSLPEDQNNIEEIRVEECLLKFIKYNRVLTIDLVTLETRLEDNKYYMDSYDREGKGEMLQYEKSLCKISIGSIGYKFNGLIRIVESCERFAAVATSSSIYIISLKENIGKSARFDIEDCIDMKWSARGLYYLQRSGNLGLLERQTTFLPKLNNFVQSMSIELSNSLMKQYIPQKIAVTGLKNINSNVVVLAVAANNPKKLRLQVVDSAKYGMVHDSVLTFQPKEVSGEIMYKNLLSIRGELTLVIVSGSQGKVQKYHQYKFGTI